MITKAIQSIKNTFAPQALIETIKTPAWMLFVSGFLSNLISIFTALYTLIVYDKVYPHDGFNTLLVLTIGVVALLVIDILLKIIKTSLVNEALYGASSLNEEKPENKFRTFSKLFNEKQQPNFLKSSIEELRKLRPGDVKTATLMVDLPFVLILLVTIFFIAKQMVLIPVIAIIGLLIYVAKNYEENQEINANIEKSKQTAIESYAHLSQGSEWLYGLGAWKWLNNKENELKQGINEASINVSKQSNYRQVVFQGVVQVVSIATVFFGFFMFQSGELGFGGIIATYLLSNRSLSTIGSMMQMSSKSNELSNQSKDDLEEESIKIEPKYSDWSLSFNDVSFTYQGKNTDALKVKSLKISAGERVAILGRSGSGKSTFAKVIIQMLKGHEGSVLFNDIPIESIQSKNWNEQCLYIPQTPWLGRGSLFEQIRLGDESITDEMIAKTVQETGLNEVLTFDQKVIKSDGLSAGQLQALGLLRCLVRKAPILILDEPTNFLDEVTEKNLIQAIFKRYQKSTIILITHRHSLLALMQRALVFDKGVLVKDGKIARLKKKND